MKIEMRKTNLFHKVSATCRLNFHTFLENIHLQNTLIIYTYCFSFVARITSNTFFSPLLIYYIASSSHLLSIKIVVLQFFEQHPPLTPFPWLVYVLEISTPLEPTGF